MLGLAETGTGKTAAFALPILQRLLDGRRGGPRALVVAPTRELASQVHATFESLARHTPLRAAVVFGGVPIARNQRALAQRPDVLVACPGRLLDLMGRGLRLDRVEVLVLDEADHMFDMGFLPDVRRILAALPRRRQNLLFSATMPRDVRRLAEGVLDRPATIELERPGPAKTIEHGLLPVAEGEKMGLLCRLLAGEAFRSAIVFLRTKRRVKRLAQRLDADGHAAVALQGNMSQGQRERALRGFREGRYDVLVATDIAARGLDIEGVSHVVNFDLPTTADAYTHRIGRTGRSGLAGTAFTFVTAEDGSAVRDIERHLGAPIRRWRPDELGAEAPARRPRRGNARERADRARDDRSRDDSRRREAGEGRGRRGRRSAGSENEPARLPFGQGVTPNAQGGARRGPRRSRRRRAGRALAGAKR